MATATIPGPLASFLRMAGISQKVSPEEVLPLLARNAAMQGYVGWHQDGPATTEFLVLLRRYVQQARALSVLAGPEGVIRVSGCADAGPLLKILGYRFRRDCGPEMVLDTADPERAFLTIDSGFPLVDLEESLRRGTAFAYSFPQSQVPVLFKDISQMATKASSTKSRDPIDLLLHDPTLARFYWAVARMDPDTRIVLEKSSGLKKLIPFAAVLDFYGSYIYIRSGRIMVPGGPGTEPAWRNLVGASPDSPVDFVVRLLAKDQGWLAAYFDALSRVGRTQQAYFTDPHRLPLFYVALLGQNQEPNAYRPIFRPNPGLLLLVTRLHWEPNGEPSVPGDLEQWKQILRQRSGSKIVRYWAKKTDCCNSPDHLIATMFGLSRVDSENGLLQLYLLLSELDAQRSASQRLTPKTVRLLASTFERFSSQFLVFSEFPDLNNSSMQRLVEVLETVDRIPSPTMRGNAMGILESNVGLWQILARQGQIPNTALNESWQRVISPFGKNLSAAQLFDACLDSLRELLKSATGKSDLSQDEIVDLLAGPPQTDPMGQKVHRDLTNRIGAVLEGQRLVSLDTLLALGEGLNQVAQGKTQDTTLLPLAAELQEFEMPQPIFKSRERSEWAPGIYNNRHTELQMRTDLTKLIKSQFPAARLAEARGQLVPFVRDTLVGLNYAYYEPPGSEILHNNPLFVRSHDFSGETVFGYKAVWQAPELFGAGAAAGGGVHLVGSLSDLPYVLATAEEDFIAPENVQALIWKEMVPGLLASAVLTRWWNVTGTELHAVALYQLAGEELLAAAQQDEKLRRNLLDLLSERMEPQRLSRLQTALSAGHLGEVLPSIMPSDTFYLTAEFSQRFPGNMESWSAAGKELQDLSVRHPAEVAWQRLSQDFGVPHPVLTRSYKRELLNLKPFPAFEGYSSRLLAESWDSTNLYWARLLDEKGYSPVMLNRLVPELTHRMVAKIFATDLEDWPAVLRAMRETGEEFRRGKFAPVQVSDTASRTEKSY
ncbi:MAG TPA: hypothetical protein VJX16_25485 [Terriglobales bacterium]|nr:hypothetical protein [Terriglobales bacterium]